VKTSAILLHDHARDDVLEGLGELGELIEALLDDVGRPRVDLVVLVSIATDGTLNRLFYYVADFSHNESRLLGRNKIIHFTKETLETF